MQCKFVHCAVVGLISSLALFSCATQKQNSDSATKDYENREADYESKLGPEDALYFADCQQEKNFIGNTWDTFKVERIKSLNIKLERLELNPDNLDESTLAAKKMQFNAELKFYEAQGWYSKQVDLTSRPEIEVKVRSWQVKSAAADSIFGSFVDEKDNCQLEYEARNPDYVLPLTFDLNYHVKSCIEEEELLVTIDNLDKTSSELDPEIRLAKVTSVIANYSALIDQTANYLCSIPRFSEDAALSASKIRQFEDELIEDYLRLKDESMKFAAKHIK